MQKKIRLNAISIVGIIILLVLLVCVRIFQSALFYDPLLPFFKREGISLPEYDSTKLFLSIIFRYFLNTVLSLGILWLVFKDKAIMRLCLILYGLLFVVLTSAYFIILNSEEVNLLLLFYVRRFLIQPLFLILFLPAFYYQKSIKT